MYFYHPKKGRFPAAVIFLRCLSTPTRNKRLIHFSPRIIGRSFIRAVKTPVAAGVLFFLLFVFANAVKTAVFNRLLIDLPAFAPAPEFFSGFLGKSLPAFILAICLTRPARRIWFVCFYIVQTLYMFVNLSYHLSLMGYLHVSQYAGLFSEAFDLVKHSAVPRDAGLWLVMLDAPLVAGMLVFYSGFSFFNKRYLFKPALACAAVAATVFVARWNPLEFSPKQSMNDAYASDASVVSRHGLLVFNIVDLFNYRDMKRHIRSLSYGPEVSHAGTAAAPSNIVAIQVESLDAFIIDTKYKDAFVTPFLHDLSNKSIYFPFMMSYHKAGSTSDCEFSTLNSVEPLDDLPSLKIRNYGYPNSVLKRFAAQGYRVEAYHGNRGSYFNRTAAFKKMGFHSFHDMFSMGLKEIGWGAPDRAVFDFVKTRLMSQKEPFFYYIITMTSHEPFTLARPYYQNNFYSGVKNEATRDYFNVMSYIDRELQEIVRSIRSSHPNTFLFIFGDHTPIIQKDVYRRASLIYDNRVFEFVPLFIIAPDARVFRESASVASFIDIAPTMLAAGGIPYSLHTTGTNLLDAPLANGIISYRGGVYRRADLFRRIREGK
jgi:phosphoglycerol transferase MdoB-like AlkP superfamily enzyme